MTEEITGEINYSSHIQRHDTLINAIVKRTLVKRLVKRQAMGRYFMMSWVCHHSKTESVGKPVQPIFIVETVSD